MYERTLWSSRVEMLVWTSRINWWNCWRQTAWTLILARAHTPLFLSPRLCRELGDRSQWLSRIFEPNFIQSSSTALVTWRNIPNLHDLNIQEGGGRRLGFRKMSITPNWIESYLRKIWWADASRPCADDTWPKLETGTFLRDVIVMMNKDVYIERMSRT